MRRYPLRLVVERIGVIADSDHNSTPKCGVQRVRCFDRHNDGIARNRSATRDKPSPQEIKFLGACEDGTHIERTLLLPQSRQHGDCESATGDVVRRTHLQFVATTVQGR